MDTLAASQSLRRLRDGRLLERQGRGSATYYVPGERLREAEAAAAAGEEGGPLSGESVRLSGESSGLSGELGGLSWELPGLSWELFALRREFRGEESDPEAAAARRRLLEPLPGDLAARVGALGRRSRPEDVTEVVLDLLRLRDWPLDELATALGRNPKYVREQYLQPMVQAGRATMTRPEEPNHPEQAYRVLEGEP